MRISDKLHEYKNHFKVDFDFRERNLFKVDDVCLVDIHASVIVTQCYALYQGKGCWSRLLARFFLTLVKLLWCLIIQKKRGSP